MLFRSLILWTDSSPYHVEKSGTLNPEIILFRPSDCDIEQLTSVPKQRMLQSIIGLVERENTIITLGVHMLKYLTQKCHHRENVQKHVNYHANKAALQTICSIGYQW